VNQAASRQDDASANLRRIKTSDVIIDVAERLWAERGVDAVSLREITLAAGLSNPASVQYHFGDKDGLVWAIFTSRLPALDQARGRILKELRRSGRQDDARAMVECLFRPLYEQKNRGGRRSYAAFLLRLLADPSWMKLRGSAMGLTPATQELLEAIYALRPDLDAAAVSLRITALNVMVLSLICRIDQEQQASAAAEAVFCTALDMAAAAFLAGA